MICGIMAGGTMWDVILIVVIILTILYISMLVVHRYKKIPINDDMIVGVVVLCLIWAIMLGYNLYLYIR